MRDWTRIGAARHPRKSARAASLWSRCESSPRAGSHKNARRALHEPARPERPRSHVSWSIISSSRSRSSSSSLGASTTSSADEEDEALDIARMAGPKSVVSLPSRRATDTWPLLSGTCVGRYTTHSKLLYEGCSLLPETDWHTRQPAPTLTRRGLRSSRCPAPPRGHRAARLQLLARPRRPAAPRARTSRTREACRAGPRRAWARARR